MFPTGCKSFLFSCHLALAASFIKIPRWGTGPLRLECFFCVSLQIKLADRTKGWLNPTNKKAYHLFVWQSDLFLPSLLIEIPSSVTPTFLNCDYWVLGFDNFFSFNPWGGGKVNKLPRRKQRGIQSKTQLFPSRQVAGYLPGKNKNF